MRRISFHVLHASMLSIMAATFLSACAPTVATPGPMAESSLDAARQAVARHWTVRVITFERDTTEGSVRLETERIRVGSRTFAPGEVFAMQRRVGSTHTAEKTLAAIALTSAFSVLLGEALRHNSPSGSHPVAARGAWAMGGASAGLAIGVFSQYGTEESRWEECWRQ